MVLLPALLCLAAPVRAHIFPIHPTRMDVREERGRLRVQFDVDGVYWSNEILHAEPPAGAWPAELTARAQNYADQDLWFVADGQRLAGKVEECRIFHALWEPALKLGAWGKEGWIRCRLSYPLAAEPKILSGKAQFYMEEFIEHHGTMQQAVPWPRKFEARLRFPGRRLSLPIEHPDFSIPGSEARRTPLQAALECLLAVGKGASAFPLALLGVALALWEAPRWAKLPIAAAAGALAIWLAAVPASGPRFADLASWFAAGLLPALFLLRMQVRPLRLFCLAVAVAPALGNAGFAWDATENLLAQKTGLMFGSLAWTALAYLAARGLLAWDLSRQEIAPNMPFLATEYALARRKQTAWFIAAAAAARLMAYFLSPS